MGLSWYDDRLPGELEEGLAFEATPLADFKRPKFVITVRALDLLYGLVESHQEAEPEYLHTALHKALEAVRRRVGPAAYATALLNACAGHPTRDLSRPFFEIDYRPTGYRAIDVLTDAARVSLNRAMDELSGRPASGELAHALGSYLQRATPSRPAFRDLALELGAVTLEGLVRLGPDGREDFLALFEVMESILARGIQLDFSRPDEQIVKFSTLLESALIAWAPGPIPFLDSPAPQKRHARTYLAYSLGMPLCLYFGAVAEKTSSLSKPGYRPLLEEQEPQARLLIARGAVRAWRNHYEHSGPFLQQRHRLTAHLANDHHMPANEEALNAILDLVRREGAQFYLGELGWDLVYSLYLLDCLDPASGHDSAYETNPTLRHQETPEAVRNALLDPNRSFDRSCFGCYIAKIAVGSRMGIGRGFYRFLTEDQKKAQERLRGRILGKLPNAKGGWTELNPADDQEFTRRMDAYLFVLRLVAIHAREWSRGDRDFRTQFTADRLVLPGDQYKLARRFSTTTPNTGLPSSMRSASSPKTMHPTSAVPSLLS